MSKKIKGEVVDKGMAEFPDLPDGTLAEKLYNENKELWANKECVRSAIRRRKGKAGKHHRKKMSDKSRYETEAKSSNPWANFPESFMHERLPYEIKGRQRILLLSDIHLPYHDPKSVQTAIKYGKQEGCTMVIVNGDLLDFYQLSRYERDPRKRKFADEIEAGRQFFQVLRYHFPNAQIIYKLGNHEERYEKWLFLKAPELLGFREFELDILLRLGEMKVHYIRDKRIIKAGKLNILHGHETQSRSGGVNPARTMALKNKENTIVGHFHRKSEHISSSLTNDMTICYSTGCLCELSPDYMPYNEWVHGFAIIDLEKSGEFRVHNHQVVNGVVY